MEKIIENPEIPVLEKAEMEAITGGAHYEWRNGELVYVQD